MNTLIPGAPLRSLSPTSNEYQRAEGVSRAAKPARVARFTLDAPEHSGTIPGARGDILTPGVALTSNLAVIFTLNQHIGIEQVLTAPRSPWQNPFVERMIGSIRRECLDHALVLDERHLKRILRCFRHQVLLRRV